ncbi:major facilitator superfamily domain-containing protein 10-like isoform X2 [Haliotis rufescens]|nr:major facilitator superfamily domain-containing protein 10-like isoform X2 [Haliotis rufescens]XP_046361064.2 major facilitator superfamily domain-containing protein 10-like isoform X2 [Haliotis rufescens]XP_048241114.1 major facilitator superfamily domain-containing protein 10-like isoform X2 [Haliotis rufescens]
MASTASAKVNNNSKTVITDAQSMTPQEEKRMNRVYTRVFLMLLLDLIAFTVILPLLPGLLQHYGENDSSGLYYLLRKTSSGFRSFCGIKDENADAVFLGGMVSSLFSFLQFLSSPIIGAASDVYGRRRMMMLCMAGVALSYVLWMLSHNFALFVLARFVGGISKGNIGLCTAIIADVSNKEKRGKGMALIGIAFSLGFIIGPAVGGGFSALTRHEEKGIFYLFPALFAFILTVSDILFIYLFLEETLPSSKRVQDTSYIWENAGKFINTKSIFQFEPVQMGSESKKSIQRIGLVYFLYMFIYSGLEFTLPFLMTFRFGYNNRGQAKMFLMIGVIMFLVQGCYTRKVKAGRERSVAKRGMMLLMPAFFILGISRWEMYNMIVFPLFAFASATVVPCMTTMVSVCGGDDQKGIIMGIFRSLGALARATGPLFFSAIFWLMGDHWCYNIGAVSLIIPLLLLRSKERKED